MLQFQKGLFIYQEDAGNSPIEQKLTQTLPVIAQAVDELIVVQTKSRDDLYEKCIAYGEQVEVLYILGGDGTVHDCINAIAPLGNRPVLGILPGGTCNDFSRMLGIPQQLDQASQSLVSGHMSPVDLGKVDNHYFLNFWGVGLVTETSANINSNQKQHLGVLSYFISALKTMNQATPFQYRLQIDQNEIREEQAVMILVMNGNFIGTKQIPVPSMYVNDGKLDILIVKNSNLTSFRELMSMTQPQTDAGQFQELFHVQAEEVKIETSQEMDVDTDGEVYLQTPGHIKVLPNHLQMIFHQETDR